jgi:hypothetical protein
MTGANDDGVILRWHLDDSTGTIQTS